MLTNFLLVYLIIASGFSLFQVIFNVEISELEYTPKMIIISRIFKFFLYFTLFLKLTGRI
jgi:flagellar biosynthesis protein FliQ